MGDAPRDKGKISGNGVILYYNGEKWAGQDSGVEADLKAVASFDGKTAVAVGSNGTTLYFDGKAWVDYTCCASANLNGVSFGDAQHVWAVGAENTIVYSEDGGANWNPQTDTDTSVTLLGVKFVDATHGWAVGYKAVGAARVSHPVVLLTTDGKKWKSVDNPLGSDALGIIRSVTFADRTTGWLVTEGGGIWKSTTRGETWVRAKKRRIKGMNAQLYAVQALNNRTAWAVGQPIKPYSNVTNTTNGTTWNEINIGYPRYLSGLSFTDPTTGWVIGTGTIYSTKAGVWKRNTLPDVVKQELRGIVMFAGNQQQIKLEELTSPDDGTAGINYLTVSGSGFPEGNINPANVVVALATECQGDASASTFAASVVNGSGDSKLLSFLLPGGLAPGQYFVTISDSAEGDASFESSNCSAVKVAQ